MRRSRRAAQAEGLLGQWLAHHSDGVTLTTSPADPDGAVTPSRAAGSLTPDTDAADVLVTLAEAGATLEAFAAGTLGGPTPPPGAAAPRGRRARRPRHRAAVPPVEPVIEADATAASEVVIAAYRDDHDDLAPRRRARLALALLAAATSATTIGASWRAWQDPTGAAISLVAALGVVAAVLWRRAARRGPRVTVVDGRLEILHDGTRVVFDLDGSTPIEILGTPGQRGWKARFVRRGLPPYVVDSAMVDPVAFTRLVESRRRG